MLSEVRGKLVEIVRQLDLAAQCPECLRDGATALHRDKPRGGTAGTLNHYLLAILGELDQPRELTLGFMHSHSDHDPTVART